jgi:hypothetical protein
MEGPRVLIAVYLCLNLVDWKSPQLVTAMFGDIAAGTWQRAHGMLFPRTFCGDVVVNVGLGASGLGGHACLAGAVGEYQPTC